VTAVVLAGENTGGTSIRNTRRPWVTHHARTSLRRLAFVAVTVSSTLVALVAGMSAAPASSDDAAPSPAAVETAEPRRQTMVVIGDSYSSYYGDRHSRFPGWWATLGTDLGLEPVVDATGGTGFLARSGDCAHTRFRARMDTIRESTPRLLFVEGGRNDWRRCDADGKPVESTRTEIVAAVEEYFDELSVVWDELGRPASDVYVLSPWGASRGDKARVIRPIIRDAARAHGFTWVDTRRLTLEDAPDGIHPNNAGSVFLRDEILANSDLPERFTAS